MTSEKLREIDRLIAEKVMGFTWAALVKFEHEGKTHTGVAMTESAAYVLPHYSSDIAAAWEVVEKLKARLCEEPDTLALEYRGGTWQAGFKYFSHEDGWDYGDNAGKADTAPLAICLAALKAAGVVLE